MIFTCGRVSGTKVSGLLLGQMASGGGIECCQKVSIKQSEPGDAPGPGEAQEEVGPEQTHPNRRTIAIRNFG